ncbi:hypothetical protein [Streptomyces chartreusis]|uniref:hypothetical protein n=1 Tax=Streptomyces chartreusis TaxID=1969 RepID=UPI0033A5869B
MTEVLLDRFFRRADLTRVLEEHFGSCRTWPLRLRAAYDQLETLRNLLGAATYSTFLRCAERAASRKEVSESRLLTMHRDYLDRELYKQYGDELPEEIKVAWAVTFGIMLLLNDQDYAHLIKAAVRADDDTADEDNTVSTSAS